MKFKTLGIFSNETDQDIVLNLEPTCEEIHIPAGNKIELLAQDNNDHFPMDILYHKDGLQIYPRLGSPEWKFIFKGKEYKQVIRQS